jgi:virulence factor Mce-like protein
MSANGSKATQPPIDGGLRARFTYRPGMHRPRTLRNGAIFFFLIVLGLYSGYTKHIPFLPTGGTEVQAVFERADHVRAGETVVRSHGVTVGKVDGVEFNPAGPGVLIRMRIDPGNNLALHSDASAAIWWRTLLGWNMYIDINPGSPSAPPLQGSIPLAHTHTQQEFDELLQPLTSTARASLQTMIGSFDQGFANPQAVGLTLHNLAPAMRGVQPAFGALLGTQSGDLVGLVRSAGVALGALSANTSDLGGLIDSADVTLGVTAARSADLGSTIDQAPATMAETRATMVRLVTTLNTLDPVARALIPGARTIAPAAHALDPALDQLNPLLRDAKPTFRRLRPALTHLGAASRAGMPLISAGTPILDRANSSILPWLGQRDTDTGLLNYEAIGPFFSVLDSLPSPYDANGHMLNFQALPDERSLHTACLTFFTDPSVQNKIDCTQLTDTLGAILGGSPTGGSVP